MPFPTIPAVLTEADWNKHKGVAAKIIKGETGIGAAMKKLKAAYDQIDWTKFDPDEAYKDAVTPADIDEAMKAAKTEYTGNVEACRKALAALRDQANKIHTAWKGNILIKGPRAHVEKIAKAAEQLHLTMKDSAPWATTFFAEAKQAKADLVVEIIRQGELPANLDYNWWKDRRPRGLKEDAKLASRMAFYWDHHEMYVAADHNSTDDKVIRKRINCLRQMVPGLDQSENLISEMINKCLPVVHDNTKLALKHYLVLIKGYRAQRKKWIDQEKRRNIPAVQKTLDEIIIGPGLDK